MTGTLYGVGVGPGDPELLTRRAERTIRSCAIIAVPQSGAGEQAALEIARELIVDKPVIHCPLPMTRNTELLAQCRNRSADMLCEALDTGTDVAFLTLGDPSVYSTYTYLHQLVSERGYNTCIVPGVPSFCAAAAALQEPLCEAGQPLHILPASYGEAESALSLRGTKVFMKSGKKLPALLSKLAQEGLLDSSRLAERVGMPGERLVNKLTVDTESGYFSIIIVNETNRRRPAGHESV